MAGRAGVIAYHEEDTVIVDAKTGQESLRHAVRVMISLYTVPRTLRRYRNAKLR